MTSICVGCGLCCDGTMYSTVEVGGGDQRELLTSAGLVFTVKDEKTNFQQPCPAFRAGCCSIYEGRPAVCREYRCLLLRRHEKGEVPYDEAKALIARTVAMRDRVRSGLTALVGPNPSFSLFELYKLIQAKFDAEPDPVASRREHAELLFEVVALRVVLAREFEAKDSKSHQPDEEPK